MIDGRTKRISKIFGSNLKKARKERKMSLRELAAVSELEHAQISRIEKGDINLTLSTIVFLADALEIPVADLLTDLQK